MQNVLFTICKPVITYVTNNNQNIFTGRTIAREWHCYGYTIFFLCKRFLSSKPPRYFYTCYSQPSIPCFMLIVHTRIHPTILNVLTYTHARTVYLKYRFYYTDANILHRKNRCLSVIITRM